MLFQEKLGQATQLIELKAVRGEKHIRMLLIIQPCLATVVEVAAGAAAVEVVLDVMHVAKAAVAVEVADLRPWFKATI